MNTVIERPDTEKVKAAFALIKRAEQYYKQQMETAGLEGYATLFTGGMGSPRVTLHTYGLRVFGQNGRHNSTWETFDYGSAEAIQGIKDAVVVQAQKRKARCR